MIKFIKNYWSIFVAIPIAVFCCYMFGYAHNITESLPFKHFLIVKTKNIAVGDYILFAAPKSSIYAGMHLIKQVEGAGGDKVVIKDKYVFINQKLIGSAKSHSKSGQSLAITKSEPIIKGNYFVATKHIDSYDSRYLDFGLINEENISGVAYPLW